MKTFASLAIATLALTTSLQARAEVKYQQYSNGAIGATGPLSEFAFDCDEKGSVVHAIAWGATNYKFVNLTHEGIAITGAKHCSIVQALQKQPNIESMTLTIHADPKALEILDISTVPAITPATRTEVTIDSVAISAHSANYISFDGPVANFEFTCHIDSESTAVPLDNPTQIIRFVDRRQFENTPVMDYGVCLTLKKARDDEAKTGRKFMVRMLALFGGNKHQLVNLTLSQSVKIE